MTDEEIDMSMLNVSDWQEPRKTLFVVEHWAPYSVTEHGGMHVVVASSADEAAALLVALNKDPSYHYYVADCVARATRIAVHADEKSRVLKSFIT